MYDRVIPYSPHPHTYIGIKTSKTMRLVKPILIFIQET